ncbi:putative DNA topoisomerase transcription factor GRF family [Helianthus debilis subsp. tardiflorus]
MANRNVICDCGSGTILLTSWTRSNPGRRFYSCVGGTCGFVTWADPPICARASQIIPGLLRNINENEAKNRTMTRKIKRLQLVLFLSWLFFFMYFITK